MSWKYEHYLREFPGSIVRVDEFDPHPGYGASARDVGAALRGCPELTKLSILIDHETNEESDERYVDPFVYGDDFWEAVVSSCPLLESIQMVDTSVNRLDNIRPIDTLTGRALVALASLKWLRQCELDPARLSGQEIFEYLRLVSKNEGIVSERVLDIIIGGHHSSRLATFYATIVTLLKLLSETREDSLGAASCPTKPVLHISNRYESRVRASWCEGYMRDELKPLISSVKGMHPSITLRVVIFGRNGNKFTRISQLTLSWRPERGDHGLFSDISQEISRRDSDSDVRIYSASDNEDESMSEDEDEERNIEM